MQPEGVVCPRFLSHKINLIALISAYIAIVPVTSQGEIDIVLQLVAWSVRLSADVRQTIC